MLQEITVTHVRQNQKILTIRRTEPVTTAVMQGMSSTEIAVSTIILVQHITGILVLGADVVSDVLQVHVYVQ